MWLLKWTVSLAGIYAAIVGLAYFLQSFLIFPAFLTGSGPELPAGTRYIDLETGDGEKVVVVRIAPRQIPDEPRPLLIGFGGNAWNADAVALMLHRIFPQYQVAAMHYRGYSPSTGFPSAAALFNDAGRVHDELRGEFPVGMIAIGLSIGASVAVELAATRRLRGLVLVTPFDSLKELAARHYPWLPVRLLLRHRMEAAETLRGLTVPVALITAANDEVVPASRSMPIRESAVDLRLSVTIEGAGHNDIYYSDDFAAALREAVDAVSGP